MYKVTENGTTKQGGKSNFEDMETINDIFEEAANISPTLCQEEGRWISDIAPHLRQRKIRV